jgi:hypothetical protein
MDVAMRRRAGVGTLFFEDGREWGPVYYAVEAGKSPSSPRLSVIGLLTPWEVDKDWTAFSHILENDEPLALRMDDHGGEWWLCLLESTSGDAVNRGGIHPAGPQPHQASPGVSS